MDTQIGKYANEVSEYFKNIYPGRKYGIFREKFADIVHIDVHVLHPTPNDDYFIIYTTGMSDLPMTTPDELDEPINWSHAEVFAVLPSTWQPENTEDEVHHWIVTMLRYVARMPHLYKTWLADGHTMPNGSEYSPVAEGSLLSSLILLTGNPPLTTSDGTRINFYMTVPITKLETEFKLENGVDALLAKFEEKNLSAIIDTFRGCCV